MFLYSFFTFDLWCFYIHKTPINQPLGPTRSPPRFLCNYSSTTFLIEFIGWWFQGLKAQIFMRYYCLGLHFTFTSPFDFNWFCPVMDFILLDSNIIVEFWAELVIFCMELYRSSGNCSIQEMVLRLSRRMVAFTKPIM